MTSPVVITLNFASVAEAAAALAKLDAVSPTLVSTWPVIAHDDRPDVGAPEVFKPVLPAAIVSSSDSPAPVGNPFAVGGAAAPVVPPSAPSTAVAAVPPTAPAVPTAGSPQPPSVPSVPAPPNVPAAAAPTAPVPPANPAAVERDAAGLPWDGRIHGSTKTKNADGTWRQKRSLDPQVKIAVEAELRAAAAATVPPAAPAAPAAPAGVAPPAPLTPPTAAASVPSTAGTVAFPSPASLAAAPSLPQAAPAVSTPPVVPSPPATTTAPTSGAPVPPTITAASPGAAPVPPAGETFGTFMARIAPRMTDPATMQHVNTALGEVGLTALAQLPAANGDVFKYVTQRIDQLLGVAA